LLAAFIDTGRTGRPSESRAVRSSSWTTGWQPDSPPEPPSSSCAAWALDTSSWRFRWRPGQTLEQLRALADEAIALETPDHFLGIGEFYLDFAQTSDEEVAALLARPTAVPPGTTASAADPVTDVDLVVGPIHLPGGELATG
jgi:hypothetical protein